MFHKRLGMRKIILLLFKENSNEVMKVIEIKPSKLEDKSN